MHKTHILFATSLSLLALGACAAVDDVGTAEESVSGRPSFEVFEGESGNFFFNFAAPNHEILLQSEAYSSRTAALGGLISVLENGGFETSYELAEAGDGQFYFNLLAANGAVIATSETYGQRSDAARAVNNTIDNVGDYLSFQASRRGARFVVFEGHDGRYFFHLRGANGAIVLQSQAYKSEAAALNGTFAVAASGTDLANYELKPSGETGFYFNVKAANGQVVGTSEVYSTAANARRACDDVATLLPGVELL